MTKSELKQIIKSLIVESINETKSKNFVSAKKTKKLKEQEETDELPMDPQASAEPDAGEVEGPEVPETAEEGEHADLLAQIDNIQQTLADLRASIQRHSIGKEETGEEEVGGEPQLNGEPEDEQV